MSRHTTLSAVLLVFCACAPQLGLDNAPCPCAAHFHSDESSSTCAADASPHEQKDVAAPGVTILHALGPDASCMLNAGSQPQLRGDYDPAFAETTLRQSSYHLWLAANTTPGQTIVRFEGCAYAQPTGGQLPNFDDACGSTLDAFPTATATLSPRPRPASPMTRQLKSTRSMCWATRSCSRCLQALSRAKFRSLAAI